MEAKPGRSFVRKAAGAAGGYIQAKGARPGSHGISVVSTGLDDLDHILSASSCILFRLT